MVPNRLAGFSFLLFNLLDSPCLAAISTMAQQMQDRKWFWFAILFQNVFATLLLFVYTRSAASYSMVPSAQVQLWHS